MTPTDNHDDKVIELVRFYEWIKIHGHKLVGLSTEQKVGVYFRDGQVLRNDKEANVTLEGCNVVSSNLALTA
jgi:hypothetical protein